jgi:hypothetical protein
MINFKSLNGVEVVYDAQYTQTKNIGEVLECTQEPYFIDEDFFEERVDDYEENYAPLVGLACDVSDKYTTVYVASDAESLVYDIINYYRNK